MSPFFKKIEEFPIKNGLLGPHFIFVYSLIFIAYVWNIGSEAILLAFQIIFQTMYIWLPIFLILAFIRIWLVYVESSFLAKQEHILLEIIPPKEVNQTPKSMELFFTSISFILGEATFVDTVFLGKRRQQWTFELVSEGGEVHLFIHTRKNLKDLVTNNLSAQYPGVQLVEVPDYAFQTTYNTKTMKLTGSEGILKKPDPYPIKTYIDFELEKKAVGDTLTDNFTHVIDFLNSVPKGHHVWMQILTRTHKEEKKRVGIFGKGDQMKEEAQYHIDQILDKAKARRGDDTEPYGPNLLTPGEKRILTAIERSVSKPAFDCGIRIIYFAPKEIHKGAINIATLTMLKAFSEEPFNQIR